MVKIEMNSFASLLPVQVKSMTKKINKTKLQYCDFKKKKPILTGSLKTMQSQLSKQIGNGNGF